MITIMTKKYFYYQVFDEIFLVFLNLEIRIEGIVDLKSTPEPERKFKFLAAKCSSINPSTSKGERKSVRSH